MGRYLRGTNGFSYKYAFAEQDDNLRELPHAMGAGRVGVVPSFGGGYKHVEQNFDIPVIPILRAIINDGVARPGEITRVVPETGNALRSSTLEFVQYALGENIVEVARRLDEALEGIPMGAALEGYAAFHLERDEYPAALAYINRFLATPATLDDLRDQTRVDAFWAELGSAENYLPAMALEIVRHAVTHDLPAIDVSESGASLYADDFWRVVPEWGPDIFNLHPPTSGAEWFTRGLVLFFNHDDDAKTSFAAAVAAGFEPAKRWASELGAKASKPTAARKPRATKKPAKKQPAAKKPAKRKPAAKKPATKKGQSPRRKAKR